MKNKMFSGIPGTLRYEKKTEIDLINQAYAVALIQDWSWRNNSSPHPLQYAVT